MSRISLDATCHSSTGSLGVSTLLPTLRYLSHRSSLRRREAPNGNACNATVPTTWPWLAPTFVWRTSHVPSCPTSHLTACCRIPVLFITRQRSVCSSTSKAQLLAHSTSSPTPDHSPFPCLCRFQLGNEVLRFRCCLRSDGLQCSLVLQNSALGLSVQHGGRMVCCDGRCSCERGCISATSSTNLACRYWVRLPFARITSRCENTLSLDSIAFKTTKHILRAAYFLRDLCDRLYFSVLYGSRAHRIRPISSLKFTTSLPFVPMSRSSIVYVRLNDHLLAPDDSAYA